MSIYFVTSVCPSGWPYFNWNCYKYFEETLSWKEARDHCMNNGGDLASVPDQKTNNFLLTLISSRAFIGGTRNSSGQWSWTDGSPFTFTHWAPGNPSGDGKVLEMVNDDGTINDLPDSAHRCFLCQQNATMLLQIS